MSVQLAIDLLTVAGVVALLGAHLWLVRIMRDLLRAVTSNGEVARMVARMVEEQAQFHGDHASILRYHRAQAIAWRALLQRSNIPVPDELAQLAND